MMPERYVDDAREEEGDEDEEKQVVVPDDAAVKKKRKSALVKSVGRTMGCRPGSVTPVLEPVSSGQGSTAVGKRKCYKSLPRGFKFKTKQVKGAANGDEEDIPGRNGGGVKGGKIKLKSQARNMRDDNGEVESSDIPGAARLVDPETLSTTIRRSQSSSTSFGSPVFAPRVVEYTSPSSLLLSRTGLNNNLPDPRKEGVKQLHTRGVNGLSDPIKRPESRRGNRHPCSSSPIPTNNVQDLRETSIFSPRYEPEDQTVARIRQRLDEVELEAGKRAWEDICRRRDRSTLDGHDPTTLPRYQRPGSREDVHEHVSREIERLRRGFVASQMNAPCQEEHAGGRYGLPTRPEPQHTLLLLDPGFQSHQQPTGPRVIFPTTTTAIPEARPAALSPDHGVRTADSNRATPTPPLRRVRHTIPTSNLAPSPSITPSHQMHPPTKSRTYDTSPNTPEDRQPIPSPIGADVPLHPHHERASPKVHEWAQDEHGKWALREVSDGEEDRPRPGRGVWRDV
ncbi:hypothetical protein FB567DRAFT_112625 [Paraphoma chrysanthemicola]|uniref:Uncharacterized protein n=1 Tax=Paraphoma chrysanthemicola TaxID=798071 RepID=A0A8K0VW72_9PLEO|nr:hypothetical protein FB567DRAFT_112625 [Paraphoma chrysanthemicola]